MFSDAIKSPFGYLSSLPFSLINISALVFRKITKAALREDSIKDVFSRHISVSLVDHIPFLN